MVTDPHDLRLITAYGKSGTHRMIPIRRRYEQQLTRIVIIDIYIRPSVEKSSPKFLEEYLNSSPIHHWESLQYAPEYVGVPGLQRLYLDRSRNIPDLYSASRMLHCQYAFFANEW